MWGSAPSVQVAAVASVACGQPVVCLAGAYEQHVAPLSQRPVPISSATATPSTRHTTRRDEKVLTTNRIIYVQGWEFAPCFPSERQSSLAPATSWSQGDMCRFAWLDFHGRPPRCLTIEIIERLLAACDWRRLVVWLAIVRRVLSVLYLGRIVALCQSSTARASFS